MLIAATWLIAPVSVKPSCVRNFSIQELGATSTGQGQRADAILGLQHEPPARRCVHLLSPSRSQGSHIGEALTTIWLSRAW
jgi:hypothetical protein